MEDTQETMVRSVLVMVGLSLLVFFLMSGQNLYADTTSTVSSIKDKPHISVAKYTATAASTPVGDDMRYKVIISPQLIFNEQKTETKVVPVIIYKGIEQKMKVLNTANPDVFTIEAGKSSDSYAFEADILSNVPPLHELLNPSDTFPFKRGVPYFFDAEPGKNWNFKVMANQMESTAVRDEKTGEKVEACRASFIVECKTDAKASRLLAACKNPDAPDETCRQQLNLCGAEITLKVENVNCGANDATVFYQSLCDGCSDKDTMWPISETAVIYFYAIDPDNPYGSCINTYTGDYDKLCYPDLLGSKVINIPVS